jgi:ubiquinone/menaquinone biosynthesis C-methylase UbiE
VADSFATFHEFEHAGWEDEQVVQHYEREVAGVTRQSSAALLDAAGVGAGVRVLDVACGPGFLAAAAAERGASTVGVDFSSAQVALARRRHSSLRFEVADAAALPFAAGSFDVVLSSFGMLHFPNAAAAAAEARRVLAPGGRFAFTVWDQPERALALGALLHAVREHGSMDVGLPAGPEFFGLSDPERSKQLLLAAGFQNPSTQTVPQVWRIPEPGHVVDVFGRASVRMRALLQAQSAEQLTQIRAAVSAALGACRRAVGYEVPMPALLAVGYQSV